MTPAWLRWVPLAVLLALGGLMAFRLGWIDAHLTEGTAIAWYAGRYVEQVGGAARVTDCVGLPGRQTWLELHCTRDGSVRVYGINRFGGLVSEAVEVAK